MYRSHSSIPYDILHGVNFSANITSILAYLNYFPPPPPIIPGPPPQRSWTCSARSLSSSSCLVSDDLNPPSLRTYIPLMNNNQSLLFTNTSHSNKILNQNSKISSILDFIQNQFQFILLLIIFLSIFIFVTLLVLLFLYIQRLRQRQLTLNSHIETNNNNNNNLELNNNNNNKTFYYRLIPYREKYQKRTIKNDENNVLRLTKHDSPVLEVMRLSQSSRKHINNNEEQEESL